MDERGINLRTLCVNTMANSDISSQEILRLLGLYRETGDPNDLTYVIMLELELLHREQELLRQADIKRMEVLLQRMTAILSDAENRMLEQVMRQHIGFRMQFRQLIAIHRERFANKLLYAICLLLLALLAGGGLFLLYRRWL